MAKPTVVFGDAGKFSIERTDKSGKVSSDIQHGNKMLETAACVRLVCGAVKGQQTMSDAWQTLVVQVLKMVPTDGYKGQGDKKTGKTPNTFKDAIRKAEDAFFDALAHDKVSGIPQDAAKRNEMVKAIRNDNNYSNIRSVCAKYFAFVGALPATDAGYLIPRPIMQAQIASVLDITPEDSSLKGRLNALIVETRESSDSKALKEALPALHTLLAQVQARIAHCAEIATNAAQNLPANGTVPAVASELLGKLQRPTLDEGTQKARETKKNKGQISPKSAASMPAAVKDTPTPAAV